MCERFWLAEYCLSINSRYLYFFCFYSLPHETSSITSALYWNQHAFNNNWVLALYQGRIYVANEFPTENHVDCQSKLRPNYPDGKTNLSVLIKKSKFYGITYKFFNYPAPYCRVSKNQHPTGRVVGTLKYAPGSLRYWWNDRWWLSNYVEGFVLNT